MKNSITKILIICVFSVNFFSSKAQMQYLLFPQTFNPATIGLNNQAMSFLSQNLLHHSGEYFGLSPYSIYLDCNLPLSGKNHFSATGISIRHDVVGFIFKTNVNLQMAFKHHFNIGTLYYGIKSGINQSIINSSIDEVSNYLPSAGFGVYFEKPSVYFAGLSANNIAFGKFKFNQAIVGLYTQYYFTAGYNYRFKPNSAFSFQPSVLLTFNKAKNNQYFSLTANYAEKVFTGFQLCINGPGNEYSILMGATIKKSIRINYILTIYSVSILSYNILQNSFGISYFLPN